MTSSPRTPSRSRKPAEAPSPESFALLSIGALSRATGIPVETLRTWERRYDFPRPAPRGDTDHRRYPLEAVDRLRLVVRALENRHAPSVVLRASLETLRDLVAVGDEPPPRVTERPRPPGEPDTTFDERCARHVLDLDGEALVGELERAWNELGGLECLVSRIGPFLEALGARWSRGEIEVGHEHFASEHVREFLSRHWRPLSERSTGPRIVGATLAGDLHVLGLHMAATALALAGARVIFLGASTPPEDIARTARRQHAAAIALSAAAGTSPKLLDRDVTALRALTPVDVPIVVGGAGFQRVPDGTSSKTNLRDLHDWAKRLTPKAGKPVRAPKRAARR